MHMTVRERADWIATFRYINVYLMETLARWVPSTPEMEVKLLFGRHLWEFAQHADALGKRTAALRVGLHASRPPTDAFMSVLSRFTEASTAGERVDGLYDGILPVMAGLYEGYVQRTDDLMDEGSVRILERALADFKRMTLEGDRIDLPAIRGSGSSFANELAELADGVSVADFRPEPKIETVS